MVIKRKHKPHLHNKVLWNLRIFYLITIILLGIVIYEILTNRVTISLALISIILGTFIGVFTARMYLFSWDKDTKKIISRLDMFGIIILVIYILASIFRGKIIGQFVAPAYVTGVSLSVATGLMIGRLMGTGHIITSILKKQNLH